MASTLVSVISGRPARGSPADTVSSLNPSRLADVVAEVALADAATFAAACAAAKRAQPSWADVPAPVRGRAAGAIGRIVEANKEFLARLVTRELGKPYAEALGEVQEIIDTCDFFLGEGRRLYGQTVPSEMPDKQLFTFRVPVGAVAVLTAGNFPVAVPSWYLIPALVTGNTVVWKPAEYAAASAMALFELIQAAGLPDGVLSIVFADYHPAIVDGVRSGDALFLAETFGPIVSVTSYTSLELANAPGYGLSSCIYTNDPREVFQFRRGIGAGMISVNNSTSGAEAHLPFGGNGKSGNGSRQSGVWVLDQFTRWQSMNWDYSGRLQKALMDVAELAADLQFRLGEQEPVIG